MEGSIFGLKPIFGSLSSVMGGSRSRLRFLSTLEVGDVCSTRLERVRKLREVFHIPDEEVVRIIREFCISFVWLGKR